MYPYHNQIKKRIKNDELIGHYFGFRKGVVIFYSKNPKEKTDFLAVSSNSCVYDFVTYENSPLYLPDLLGGEE